MKRVKPSQSSESMAKQIRKAVEESGAEQFMIFFLNGEDLGTLVNGNGEFIMACHESMVKQVIAPGIAKVAEKLMGKEGLNDNSDSQAHPVPNAPLNPESEGYKLFERLKAASDKAQ